MFRSRILIAAVSVVAVVATAQPAAALTSAPDVTWSTDGRVYALAQLGDTLFIGGKFNNLTSPDGSQTISAKNLAALDMATGAPLAGFDARVTNTALSGAPWVRALAVSADGSMLYVGGKFDTIGGETHSNLGAVKTTDGSVVSSYGVTPNQAVNVILPGPDRVYIGGDFKRVNNKPRKYLAALSASGTLDTTWRPSADATVRSLTFASDGATVFVGGKFLSMNSTARTAVARVDAVTGALDPWAIPAGTIDLGNMAWDLLATPTRLYGGFGNGPNYTSSFRLDNGTTGSQVWKFNSVGNSQSLAFNPDGSRLFVAGHFGTARLQQSVCGGNLRGLMMLNPATGQLDCSWLPQLVPYGSNYVGGWTLLSTPTQVWVGGRFTSISGVGQEGIARFTI